MDPTHFDPTNSYRSSSLRHLQITPKSILVGDDDAAFYAVHCGRKISEKPRAGKAVFEAEIDGLPCVAKCWRPDLIQPFSNECLVYEKLTEHQPPNSNVFPKLIGWSKIVCSSLFPAGHVLLLEKRPGVRLSQVWKDLTQAEKTHIQNECAKATRILRSVSIRLADAGKHNVLFDRETGTVTLLDFELIGICEFPEDTGLEPEMTAILADEEWCWWVQV